MLPLFFSFISSSPSSFPHLSLYSTFWQKIGPLELLAAPGSSSLSLSHAYTAHLSEWCGSGGDAHLPPNLKKKKKEVSVDCERYRQLRPRARELIDQEANENLVGNMWFNIDDDSNLKRERKLFFGSRVRKTLTKPFFENARQPVKEAGRKPCLLPVRVNIPFDR